MQSYIKVSLIAVLGIALCLNMNTALGSNSSDKNNSDKTASNVELHYYSKLAGIITPMLEYNPRGKINKKMSQGMKHYQVEYDQQKRLKRIRFYHGQWPSNDAYFYAHDVRYEYKPKQTIRRYFDIAGEPMGMWRHYYRGGEIHKEVYSHEGDETTLTIFDTKNEQIEVGTGSYTFKRKQINDDEFIQWQFKKDGSPNTIFDYLPFEVSKITKDQYGYLDRIIAVDPKTFKPRLHPNAGFAEMRIDFDRYGNEIGWHFKDQHGDLINRPAEGDDPGYAAWRYTFEWLNEKLGLFTKLTERYFGEDERRFCKESGVCEIVMTQDNDQNFTGQSFHNKEGQLIVDSGSKFARVTIDYNSKGQRKEMRYFNDKAKLRTEGVAVRRYQYDENGKESEVVELNSDLKPVEKKDEE